MPEKSYSEMSREEISQSYSEKKKVVLEPENGGISIRILNDVLHSLVKKRAKSVSA